MDVRPRELLPIVTAALVHGLVAWGVARSPLRAPTPTAASASADTEIDLSAPVTTAEPTPVPTVSPDRPTSAGAAARAPARAALPDGPVAASAVGATAAASADEAAGSGAPPTSAAARPEATAGGGAAVPLALSQLGVGGPNRFLTAPPLARGGERPSAAESAARDVERSMAQSRADHDRGVGLGPEGPLLAAVEAEIMASALPLNGKASFDATFDARGALTALVIVSTDGDRSGWETVAASLRRKLGGKPGRAVGAAGMLSRVEVDTALKMPSGRDPGLEVEILGGVPLKKAPKESKHPSKIVILDPIPKVHMVPVDDEGKVRLPVPQVGVTVLGIDGDPVDIAALARRVVHARVTSQRVL